MILYQATELGSGRPPELGFGLGDHSFPVEELRIEINRTPAIIVVKLDTVRVDHFAVLCPVALDTSKDHEEPVSGRDTP